MITKIEFESNLQTQMFNFCWKSAGDISTIANILNIGMADGVWLKTK